MKRPSCKRRHWQMVPATSALFLAVLLSCVPGLVAAAGTGSQAKQHNDKGVGHFEAAYYQHVPKGNDAEAVREYALAASEFEDAIKEDPEFSDPHRNLARLRFIEKKFADAAREYGKVTELDPFDLDAYVNLALAHVELKNYQAAIDALRQAKLYTSDDKARATLDGYIEKVRRLQ